MAQYCRCGEYLFHSLNGLCSACAPLSKARAEAEDQAIDQAKDRKLQEEGGGGRGEVVMSANLNRLLSILAKCVPGTGLSLGSFDRRVAAKGVGRGWIEWMAGGSLRVYLITDEGRKALSAEE